MGQHIPYLSNPESTYTAGQWRGNARCNCTTVINNRNGLIAGFANAPATAAVSNRTWRANEYGDILATSSITVSGVNSVNDTAELSSRSTGAITINSGFTVTKGGKLTVSSGSGALAKRAIADAGFDPPPIVSVPSELKFSVFATSNAITYQLPSPQSVRVRVFDIRGRIVFEKNLGIQDGGRHIQNIDLSRLHDQSLYMMEFVAGSQRERFKLVGSR